MQRIHRPALASTERIDAWLLEVSNPNSDAEAASSHLRPRKRRRYNDSDRLCPMERSRQHSPSKRPRVDRDEPITPAQSTSVMGSAASVTSLTEKTTLSVRSSASRSSSPQRQITQLRTAHPPISLHPLAAAAEYVPPAVVLRIRALQARLRYRLEKEYIPAYLRDALERDPTYKASLLFDPLEDAAYHNDEEVEEHADAALVLDRVKAVFQGTHLCKEHNMDENAWTLHVVTPLLQLAIIMYGRGRFRQEGVQSQSIQPAYLSTVASRPSKPIPIFRKTDFCFSFSHLYPPYASLYRKLRHAPISHTTDTYTEATALYTGIEVKSLSGNLQEAQLQMAIWMAASLHKKAELAWSAFATGVLPLRPDHATFIEPSFTMVGTELKVYYAYLSEPSTDDLSPASTCATKILGNDTSLPSLDTSSLQGIWRAARLFGNIMEYAADEDEESGYWGAFLGPVLRSVAAGVEEM